MPLDKMRAILLMEMDMENELHHISDYVGRNGTLYTGMFTYVVPLCHTIMNEWH